MKNFNFAAALICMMFAGLATADALPVDPGLWKFTSTGTNPMTGQKQSETETQCMVEDEYDPVQDLDDGKMDCSVTESKLDGDQLTFSMSCNTPGGKMTMSGVYQSAGDSVQGTMAVKMSFGGQTMTAESSFVGKRIGDCQ